MPFEYPWTCEAIDSNITHILDAIRNHIINNYKEEYEIDEYDLTPDMQSEIEMEAQVLYCNIRDSIEAIRLTNSGIRTAAEDQVSRLEDRVMLLEHYEDELYEQRTTILDLERQIVELEFVIKRDGHGKEK